jgi:uncharacterized protein Yka (UPF0111/DUF47 family)
MLGVVIVILVALGFDYVNGFHDAANSIATVVSTRVLSPRMAVAWAAFFNFIAFLVFGTHTVRLNAIAEEVMRVESRADDLHEQGLKDLFKRHGRSDPMAYLIGSEIYGQLEKVVDRFEDVANEISGIVIENV